MKFIIKEVSIPVKDQLMEGTIYIPDSNEDKLPGVVIFHGRGSSQARYTDRAEELAKAGFITLIFSFRGCGNSDGDFKDQTIKMGHEDALAGYDYLLKQGKIDKNRIGVWGGSYGGYHATILTKYRSINSLFLSVPALYRNEGWDLVPETSTDIRRKYREGNDFVGNKALEVLKEYKNPLLLSQHEFDEVCPRKQTDAFYDNAINVSKKKKIIVKGLGHRLVGGKERSESNKQTVEWFKETL